MTSSLLLIPRWIPWVAKYIPCSLISWADSLGGEVYPLFVASYLLVDSLSCEVSSYPSIISTNPIFSF